jgi:hypothetical protein
LASSTARGVAQISSSMPAALTRLPQTRDGKARPGTVSTGTPIHIASEAVVCAP